jgi:hypothetical protein
MFPIILHTIQQFLRNKLLWAWILSWIIWIIFLVTLSQLALSEQAKVFIDFALTLIELWTLMIVLYTGSTLLENELKNKTFVLLYLRIGSKRKILLAKFRWFAIVLALIMIILATVTLLTLAIQGRTVQPILIYALRASFLKILITFGIVFALSTASQPFIAFLGGLVIYIAAHRAGLIKFFATLNDQFSYGQRVLFETLYIILPNFAALSPKEHLLNPAWVSTPYQVLRISIYGLIRVGLLLLITIRSFNQKPDISSHA